MSLKRRPRLEQRSDDLAQDCVLTAADWGAVALGDGTTAVAFAAGTLYFRGSATHSPASYLFCRGEVGSYSIWTT